jgi:hypothetical protein
VTIRHWDAAMLATLLVACTTVIGASAPEKPKLMVFITGPIRDGFVDTSNGIIDAIADVERAVGGPRDKLFEPAQSRETADLVLTVLGRGRGANEYRGTVMVPSGASVFALPHDET